MDPSSRRKHQFFDYINIKKDNDGNKCILGMFMYKIIVIIILRTFRKYYYILLIMWIVKAISLRNIRNL